MVFTSFVNDGSSLTMLTANMLLRLQNIVLEMIAKGDPLERTMDRLLCEVEALAPNTVCSVVTVDAGGKLHPLSAPKLPKNYCACLDGAPIGPACGSCGTAAYRGEPVSVRDIRTDPLWAVCDLSFLPSDLVACWSSPILDSRRRVLGAFAFYFREHRGPNDLEEQIVETCSHLCAIAIERNAQKVEHQRLAFTDTMTGLSNRAGFNRTIATLGCEVPRAWGLLMVDLDNLKKVNDMFGHHSGDRLIAGVASVIVSIVPKDRAFRLGGDEFAVLVRLEDGGGCVAAIAEKILEALKAPMDCAGHVIAPRATIGGAVLTDQDTSPDDVRRNADLALYHAKETKRGRFVVYEEGLRTTITQRFNAIRLLTDALKDNRVEAFYQPIVRLDTAEISGVEALCRVITPDGETIPAAKFHEATSDVLVASALTQRMIALVARDIRQWLDMGVAIRQVGINVTAADFHEGKLGSRIAAAFGEVGVSLDHVTIEITESVYLDNLDYSMTREIDKLRLQGVCVALDDFGTGYASLTHLLNVPVDMIKIDKSFVHRMEPQNASFAIVKGLIGIARDLGIRVVAEGIETPLQAAQLRGIGCTFGQGFHIARPLSRHAMTKLLMQRNNRVASDELAGTEPISAIETAEPGHANVDAIGKLHSSR
jgi:diguanylate cyclase (GGDEF)-like protein